MPHLEGWSVRPIDGVRESALSDICCIPRVDTSVETALAARFFKPHDS
jgi:hypothetical protein